MPRFGKLSKKNLRECDPRLQKIFNEVIKHYDCKVIEGRRTEAEQNSLYYAPIPKTSLKFPNSKHNHSPSLAADVVPFPIDWMDADRFIHFAGFVKGVAVSMNIGIIWGGDWNNNNNLKDQKFFDLPHFEIAE